MDHFGRFLNLYWLWEFLVFFWFKPRRSNSMNAWALKEPGFETPKRRSGVSNGGIESPKSLWVLVMKTGVPEFTDHFGPVLDHVRPVLDHFRPVLDHCGPFWTRFGPVLDLFWPTNSGSEGRRPPNLQILQQDSIAGSIWAVLAGQGETHASHPGYHLGWLGAVRNGSQCSIPTWKRGRRLNPR